MDFFNIDMASRSCVICTTIQWALNVSWAIFLHKSKLINVFLESFLFKDFPTVNVLKRHLGQTLCHLQKIVRHSYN